MTKKKPELPKFVINVMSSDTQEMLGDKNYDSLVLGLDAEILPRKSLLRGVLWPHQHKCPQERGDSAWITGDMADWHGDGYAFELCVKPTRCIETLIERVGLGMRFLSRKFKSPLKFSAPTIYSVPTRVVRSAPAEVKRLGCMPSFNVYDDPGDPESLSSTERTTGCHLHVSHPWFDNERAKTSVRWADILVGNVWNYISPEKPEVEAARRAAYGRAGEHRRNIYPNKVFGFEYRVLPGRVLANPSYLSLMYSLLRHAVHAAKLMGEPDEVLSSASRQAINTADKGLSRAIIEKLPFSADSMAVIGKMAERPLPTLSTQSWYNHGLLHRGHVEWYYEQMRKKKGGS